MLKRIFALTVLFSLIGCSALSLEILSGPMNRLGNQRYGYHLLIPRGWKRSVNSDVRPTEVIVRAPENDYAIIVLVDEGGKAPELEDFIKSQIGQENVIRSWRVPFDDTTGYIVNFAWKGTKTLYGHKYGKAGTEYQATVAVVERDPSPITLLCYAPKSKFQDLNVEYFGHARDSLKVEPVEITVREVE